MEHNYAHSTLEAYQRYIAPGGIIGFVNWDLGAFCGGSKVVASKCKLILVTSSKERTK
jgi:hypothetical protein